MKTLTTDYSGRLGALIDSLEQGLVERRRHVRLAVLAALAGEHTLLIGPAGTAKSELARRLHSIFRDAAYFERLLTRFSVPEELFGPLSIRALEDDRYERHTAGFLPEASVAFIDEVFKANSAILNALLTLLNEREFDNGAGRQRCPLITVIGATNSVPEDEVGEAFFDRFLLRLPVDAVSAAGFGQLLRIAKVGPGGTAPNQQQALGQHDLAALNHQAGAVAVADELIAVLGELRQHCMAQQWYVSDRRWVKTVWLLRIAACTAGRAAVSAWDLLLLPYCMAPDADGQDNIAAWLQLRLGVQAAYAPERLTRVVEAFEAQLTAENQANDLDYDEAGRLKFSDNEAASVLADSVGDAKGGARALRLSYNRRRRYGALHIGARVRQIDELLLRIAGYAQEIATRNAELAAYRDHNLWLDDSLLEQVGQHLAGTAGMIASLSQRMQLTRQGFLDLPRLEQDDGRIPDPIDHELVAEA